MKKNRIILLLSAVLLLNSCIEDNKHNEQQEDSGQNLQKVAAQQNNSLDFEKLISKGQEHLKDMQFNKANEIFLRAIEVKPDEPDGYYGLGVSYTLYCQINNKDCEKGIKYLDKVLQMDAKYRRTYYNRAICKDKLGNSHGAIDDLNMQISLDSTDPDYYHNRAVIKLQLGDTTAACNDFTKSYELGNAFDKASIENLCN